MPVRARCEHGTTLVELTASIVIVAVATLGLMLAIATVAGHSADPMVEHQAVALAEGYLEEVARAAFCDPDFVPPGQSCRALCTASACASGCGGSGALHEPARGLWDDVCDYDGLADAGARDRDDAPIAGLGAYGVSVDVVDAGVGFGSPPLDADAGEVVRIDISVTHPGLEHDVRLSTWRANTR